ncbi:phasin family protein [Fuscibacter oryzae]|uniref:Phasin family protein n=1 Tax=Fuscibacter oryzae TaxID=2803939 RepID=A0A8J7SXN9_9RHOB|nr:phasin family protein [Fuscibacter oryzae]MBL4930189.1 phasin family protein [Fuscibacter oryzae]
MAELGLPMAVGSAAVQAWMDMGTEAVRFVCDRLQQDIKTQQAMLACTSLEEIRKVQVEFFTAAQDQYAAEAGKMLNLMGKAAAGGLTALPKARRYDDVPL